MEKRKNGKNGKNKSHHLGFLSTIYLVSVKMYKKFEDSGSHRSREICNGKVDWRERKMDQ